ncbi:MAG: ZIP family metal transporter [Patescibacteria group bacterium]
MNLWLALVSVSIVSLLSLLGALFLVLQRRTLEAIITYTLAFSSGILLGSVFFDLLPEAASIVGESANLFVVLGIIAFFALEKFIHWHHCAEGEDCQEKPVAYLTLVGDGIHNFLDGAIIGVAFLASVPLGITTTLAVIAHEVPHELGDFLILIYGGFNNTKALWYNFFSALTAILGTVTIFLFANMLVAASPYLIGFAAGNFLYIAASDLIPELHTKRQLRISVAQTLVIVFGITTMWILTRYFEG